LGLSFWFNRGYLLVKSYYISIPFRCG
jgi:hypothetical protein